MPQLNFRVRDLDLERIERLAARSGLQKTAVIQRLLEDADERYGQPAEAAFIEGLFEVHGCGAHLRFTIESDADRQEWPWVGYSIKCEVEPDTTSWLPATSPELKEVQALIDFDLDERERLTISLRDWNGPTSVWVATIPFRPSSTVVIDLVDLHPFKGAPGIQQASE